MPGAPGALDASLLAFACDTARVTATDDTAARPAPVADLDWDAARMRGLADRAVALYGEYLEQLAELPVSRGEPAQVVRDAVLRPVPELGLDDDQLLEHLRSLLV